MLTWFSENIGSIILLIILIAIVLLIVRYLFKKKKSGGICSGDCCSCHGACPSHKKKNDLNK